MDALQRGYKLGIIASGDHNGMGVGVAALYVREVSRAGIIEALQARRCFGTTGEKMFIYFEIFLINGENDGVIIQGATHVFGGSHRISRRSWSGMSGLHAVNRS